MQRESLGALAPGRAGIEQFLRWYLSVEHRDDREDGCPSAALLDEIGRGTDATKMAYTDGVLAMADDVAARLAPHDPQSVRLTVLARLRDGDRDAPTLPRPHRPTARRRAPRTGHPERPRRVGRRTAEAQRCTHATLSESAILDNYDVVLHSQDGTTLEKSLRVLKPGGRLISISGPPDPAFGDDIGAPWFVKPILRAGSSTTRRRAKRLQVDYSFLFMRANGTQLTEITSLIDAGTIRPILDRVFPFASTNEAIAYVESGRAKGKVVVTMR